MDGIEKSKPGRTSGNVPEFLVESYVRSRTGRFCRRSKAKRFNILPPGQKMFRSGKSQYEEDSQQTTVSSQSEFLRGRRVVELGKLAKDLDCGCGMCLLHTS